MGKSKDDQAAKKAEPAKQQAQDAAAQKEEERKRAKEEEKRKRFEEEEKRKRAEEETLKRAEEEEKGKRADEEEKRKRAEEEADAGAASTSADAQADTDQKHAADVALIRSMKRGRGKVPAGEYVFHDVTSTDTMVGLSLRYGVSAREIMSANGMFDDNVFAWKRLVVPTVSGSKAAREVAVTERQLHQAQQRMRQRFKDRTNCDDLMSAEVYLSETKYDLEAAVKRYEEDSAWEHAHGGPPRRGVPVEPAPPTKTLFQRMRG